MSHVGVNLLWMVPGQVGGTEESTLASLRALAARADADLDLRLFVSAELLAAHGDLADHPRVEVLPWSTRSRATRILAESTWLARATKGLDLVHHAGGTVPLRRSTPCVLTLHDLQPLERQATHGRVKRAYLSLAIPRSVSAARRVVVPSEFVRRSVLARFGTDPAKVVVVHHGVARSPGEPEDVIRARYDLPGPVVLYPAITYPHKNHRVLVAAFAEVVRRRPETTLVLTGGAGTEELALRRQVADLGLEARVRRTGRIPARDVAGLYDLADVVAVPSHYEGFGLPAAEAMVHGRALVAARTTALPEVVGDAGVLVDPDDVTAWADALARLLGDPAERGRLAAAGAARSARWTWQANAAALTGVYREALASGTG